MREVMAQSDVAPNETVLAWKHEQMARRLVIRELRALGLVDDSLSGSIDTLLGRVLGQMEDYYREFYGEEA